MRCFAWLCLLISTQAIALPSGKKWFLTPCTATCRAGTQCVDGKCVPEFRIAASIDNQGGMTIHGAGVAYSAFVERAPEVFKNWTKTRVSMCSTRCDMAYAGTFSSPSGVAAVNRTDGLNNVIWLSGAAWRYSQSTLALTTRTWHVETGEIHDVDMEINANQSWAADERAGSYDIESMLLHEVGHFIGIDHTPSSFDAVMYPHIPQGAARRTLQAPDIADVCEIYPGAPGGQGEPCTMASMCTESRVCEGRSGTSSLICTKDCSKIGDVCPTGFVCQNSTSGMACLPQVGAPDQCKHCSSGQDCSSGLCLRENTTGVTYCSRNCIDASQCDVGFQCETLPEGKFCIPSTQCKNQCTSGAECTIGFSCKDTACTPTGNAGDRCEISLWCKACNTCVRDAIDPQIGFCRSCCGGGSGDGLCKGCPNNNCGADAGFVCTQLTNLVDSVCFSAAPAPGACQSCDGTTCAEGLSCVAGRCHSACSPESPGSCAACYTTGTATGVCACNDEVAVKGEPCGTVAGGGISVCGGGLACVGSPQKICRSICDKTAASSCRTGESCQNVDGVEVCMPGSPGSRCAACLGDNSCGPGLTCYLGRCYESCNVNLGSSCSSCVATQSPIGVCACDDQLSAVNEACSSEPSVHGCQAGTRCIDGTCRSPCDVANPLACPDLTQCMPYAGSNYCMKSLPPDPGGNTGGGGSTGKLPDGGIVSTSDQGCGCESVDALSLILVTMITIAMAASRRSAR